MRPGPNRSYGLDNWVVRTVEAIDKYTYFVSLSLSVLDSSLEPENVYTKWEKRNRERDKRERFKEKEGEINREVQ